MSVRSTQARQRFWIDALPSTSLGTGVASTQLNGGSDFQVPSGAGVLVEITPEIVSTGAHTAGESHMIRSITTSPDITTIVPKQFVFSGALGGLGTFDFTMAPILTSYAFNTALMRSTDRLAFNGQPQIANTVAPEMSLSLTFGSGGPMPGGECYYSAPAAETSTGTAAGNVAGNNLEINSGNYIDQVYSILTPGTVTASEDIHGRGQLASSDFLNVPSTHRFHAQPIAAGLGTAVSVAIGRDRWNAVHLPINRSFVGETSFNLDEALTAAANFIVGVRYKK